MTGRDPILDRDVGEQRAGALLLASHPGVSGYPLFAGVGGLFSELLGVEVARRAEEGLVAWGAAAVTMAATTTPESE
jgi:hypothetical protein